MSTIMINHEEIMPHIYTLVESMSFAELKAAYLPEAVNPDDVKTISQFRTYLDPRRVSWQSAAASYPQAKHVILNNQAYHVLSQRQIDTQLHVILICDARPFMLILDTTRQPATA